MHIVLVLVAQGISKLFSWCLDFAHRHPAIAAIVGTVGLAATCSSGGATTAKPTEPARPFLAPATRSDFKAAGEGARQVLGETWEATEAFWHGLTGDDHARERTNRDWRDAK